MSDERQKQHTPQCCKEVKGSLFLTSSSYVAVRVLIPGPPQRSHRGFKVYICPIHPPLMLFIGPDSL